MDPQIILVVLLFALSVFWVGRTIYKSLNSKKGCASNCGKCSADFSDIEVPGGSKS